MNIFGLMLQKHPEIVSFVRVDSSKWKLQNDYNPRAYRFLQTKVESLNV